MFWLTSENSIQVIAQVVFTLEIQGVVTWDDFTSAYLPHDGSMWMVYLPIHEWLICFGKCMWNIPVLWILWVYFLVMFFFGKRAMLRALRAVKHSLEVTRRFLQAHRLTLVDDDTPAYHLVVEIYLSNKSYWWTSFRPFCHDKEIVYPPSSPGFYTQNIFGGRSIALVNLSWGMVLWDVTRIGLTTVEAFSGSMSCGAWMNSFVNPQVIDVILGWYVFIFIFFWYINTYIIHHI